MGCVTFFSTAAAIFIGCQTLQDEVYFKMFCLKILQKKKYIFSQIRFVKVFCQHHGITGITVLERIY
jgi:hypothetical protein